MTEATAREILRLFAERQMPQVAIAKRLGVSVHQVYNTTRGHTWAHVR
jgi:DNA-binding CsgD family transcriptional regulator